MRKLSKHSFLQFSFVKYLVLALMLFMCLKSFFVQPVYASTDARNFKAGDLVQFGKYLDEDIWWVVIAFDDDNNPILWSKHILALKPLNGAPSANTMQTVPFTESALRHWMNSEESENVFSNFNGITPTKENVWNEHNAYDEEGGFLNAFNKIERSVIQTKDGDTVSLLTNDEINNLSDSLQEFKSATPTNSALDKSTYTSIENQAFFQNLGLPNSLPLSSGNSWWYWVKSETPQKNAIFPNGPSFSPGYSSGGGFRPSLVLSQDAVFRGSGTNQKPYILKQQQPERIVNLSTQTFEVSSDTLKSISQENQSLLLENENFKMEIPNSVLNDVTTTQSQNITVNLKPSDKEYEEMMTQKMKERFPDLIRISNVSTFTIQNEYERLVEPIREFTSPLEITFKDVKNYNPENHAVYNVVPIHDAQGNITDIQGAYYQGGDLVNEDVSFFTNHLSLFLIMEQNPTFHDVESHHWAFTAIKKLSSIGIIRGYNNKTFNPGSPVSRGDFSILLNKVLELKPANFEVLFSDLKEKDYFSGDVISLAKLKITDILPSVNSNSTFRAYSNSRRDTQTSITREEAAKFIANGYAYLRTFREELPEIIPVKTHFTDQSQVSPEHKDSISIAQQLGLMIGYKENDTWTFKPKNILSRAEASQVLVNFMALFKNAN